MAKTMTPSSSITDGQIDKAGDVVRAVVCKNLREHRSEFVSETVQQILGSPAFGHKALAVFRQMYEAVSGMITRHVKNVNRNRTPQQMLDALARRQYTNREVVNTMPRGEGDEDDVFFFQVGRDISDDELEAEFESRNFVPVDPYKLAAVNEDDPSFADEHPNGTHWKDANGCWCYLACRRGDGERRVFVRRNDYVWLAYWWFAGVRKSLDS